MGGQFECLDADGDNHVDRIEMTVDDLIVDGGCLFPPSNFRSTGNESFDGPWMFLWG